MKLRISILIIITCLQLYFTDGQFLFGHPQLFLTSNDTDATFDTFQLIHDGNRFYKLSEYVQFGIFDTTKFHIVYIDTKTLLYFTIALTVEDTRLATISQNLQKELFFAHYNSSGVFPQMRIINTTFVYTLPFYADEQYPLSYMADYEREFKTMAMAPPYDIIVEVPGYSNSLKTYRTLIDVQSFALQRFQLSPDPPVTYDGIMQEAVLRTLNNDGQTLNLLESSMKIISNPCIQDYFLVSMRVGMNGQNGTLNQSFPIHTYIQVPAHYSLGNDGCWTNITSIYCSNLNYTEACGEPEDMILTNRHFLVLSSKGLLVSNDLSESTIPLTNVTKPLARFNVVDPCRGLIDQCFSSLSKPAVEEHLIYTRKLHYTPFCDVHQYPNNDDMVIFVLEQTDKSKSRYGRDAFREMGPTKTYSVIFAARPYKNWRPLFVKQEMFEDRYILEIVGLFYNPHLERFDITMKLSPPLHMFNGTDIEGNYVRFILPLPVEEPYLTDGYPHLSGSWGQEKGFIVSNFSESFRMKGVVVNPGTMDVIFYGSEMYIAESGRSIMYQAIGGFMHRHDTVTGCHFNHPDRFYVCMLSKKMSILIGRVATWYGPVEVELLGLDQIQQLIDVIFAVAKKFDFPETSHPIKNETAQWDVLQYILDRAFFTASNSGKIFAWYFSNPKFFYQKILEHDAECDKSENCTHYPFPKRPELFFNKTNGTCGDLSCGKIPCVLPLSLDPLKFRVKKFPTSGALAPFFIDAETLLLYEAFIPGRSHNDENYLSAVHIGQKFYCEPEENHTETDHSCELYFRHIKLLVRGKDSEGLGDNSLIPGFRSVTYATILTPIPMFPVQDRITIQMPEDSNRVRIFCTQQPDSNNEPIPCVDLKAEDLGLTLYIPGEFSVMLQGYDWQIEHALIGIATHKTVLPFEVKLDPYSAYTMSMRTEKHSRGLADPQLFKEPYLDPNYTYGCNKNPPAPCHLTNNRALIDPEQFQGLRNWKIGDGGCQFELTLMQNTYIKASGGKIDLDLQDSVSFEVELRPLNGLGRKMLYRPLMVATQSNPDILQVLSKFKRYSDRQTLSVLLKPTGIKQGVSSFVIRSIVSSISCPSPSSFTFIVQCVRAEGRRLEVAYPNIENVTDEELLQPGKPIYVEDKPDVELFTVLPVNYRPPSQRGIKIPTTSNVYNADPSKPLYNSWYKFSNESAEFKSCKLQKRKENCGCTPVQKLSDDPLFSDCKEKALVVKRDSSIQISLTYPPRQVDAEQLVDFFSPAPEIAVKIEEINGRVDFHVGNGPNMDLKLINTINKDPVLNMDDKYYLATNLTFKLYGTGLYHFKATLGRFHTFNDVSGYIILFSTSKEVDDVMLVMLVILTMTLCFVLIFFGFLRCRHSLVAQLPIRIDDKKA